MNSAICTPSLDEFLALARQGNVVPVSVELIADAETPVSAFHKLGAPEYSYLLESAETTDIVGRFSFLGLSPHLVVVAQHGILQIRRPHSIEEMPCDTDPLRELQRLMGSYRPVPVPGFGYPPAGAVGYIGYDMVRFFEPAVGKAPHDDLAMPEMAFMVARQQIVFDHRRRRMRIVANAFLEEGDDPKSSYREACQSVREMMNRLTEPAALRSLHTPELDAPEVIPQSNMERCHFENIVERAKEYIRAGDIFQVVLSQRFETAFTAEPLDLYRALRFVNPSPYLFCLRFDRGRALVGSSPEVHVRVLNGQVELRPIAGTRRRGATPEEDDLNARDLLADPKERAEHVMLVDLGRNDVGRVAQFGSVQVTDFMTIEKYSHVQHIVSNVVGKLLPEKNAYDVLRATFPAGTVSGAPKVRAMQIINELEPTGRGTYAGAVAYFGFDGGLDSCITLRSVLLKDGRAFIQAGAGIVADSTPEGEYTETVNKSRAMMRAIELAATPG